MADNLISVDNSPNSEQIYENECDYEIVLLNYKNIEYKLGESVFTELNIYETLFEDNVIKGDITLLDGSGFEERFPIIGQEKIKISFNSKRTPETRITGTFLVYKMSEKIMRDRLQMYTLFFVSEEYIINLKNKVSKSYKGKNASEIISDIYDNYIVKNVNDEYKPLFYDKVGDSDSSYHLNHYVFPRIRPFQAINMVARRATPINTIKEGKNTSNTIRNFSSFIFYENSKGFWFKSISDLLDPVTLKQSAEFKDNNLDAVYEEKGIDSQNESTFERENKNKLYVKNLSVSSSVRVPMANYVISPQNNFGYNFSGGDISVQSYRFISTFDVVSNIVGGMYGSKLLTYDPITQVIGENFDRRKLPTISSISQNRTDNVKKIYNYNGGINEYEYNYLVDFYDFRHISEGDGIFNSPLTSTNHPGLKGADAMYKFKVTNLAHSSRREINLLRGVLTGNSAKFSTFDNQVERYILTSNAQRRMLKNILIQIKVSGDQNRKIGEIVNLKIPSSYYTNSGIPQEHTFYQGNYLITKIRHTIKSQKSQYFTEMELVKDSLFNALLPVENYVNAVQEYVPREEDEPIYSNSPYPGNNKLPTKPGLDQEDFLT